MPTPPPVRKPRPGAQAAPPKPIQAPSPAPVLSVPVEVEEPVQALPEPKKLKIRTRYGYPIYIPHLDRKILPSEIAEVGEHAWILRQIALGTFISL